MANISSSRRRHVSSLPLISTILQHSLVHSTKVIIVQQQSLLSQLRHCENPSSRLELCGGTYRYRQVGICMYEAQIRSKTPRISLPLSMQVYFILGYAYFLLTFALNLSAIITVTFSVFNMFLKLLEQYSPARYFLQTDSENLGCEP